MTGCRLDTNVVSEARTSLRADAGVRAWMADLDDDELFLSVLTVGELRTGVERIRRRDPVAAGHLDTWLDRLLVIHSDRILDIDLAVVRCWVALNVPDPVPVIDGLIAVTALTHALTVATRNVRDFRGSGARVVGRLPTEGWADSGNAPAHQGVSHSVERSTLVCRAAKDVPCGDLRLDSMRDHACRSNRR